MRKQLPAGSGLSGAWRRRPSLWRITVAALATGAVATVAMGTIASPTSAAEACPNAAIRADQGTQRLSDCRAYEQVSPVDKNGYPVYFSSQNGNAFGVTRMATDGSSVVFESWGSFAGAPSGMPTTYKATRGLTGWGTRPVSPPPTTPTPNAFTLSGAWVDATPDLQTGLIGTADFYDPTDANNADDVYVQSAGGSPALVSRADGPGRTDGSGAEVGGLSSDGTHVAFLSRSHLVAEDADRLDGKDLYIRAGDHTTLLNLGSDGRLIGRCGSMLGSGDLGTMASSISSDGSHVVFEVPNPTEFADSSCFAAPQVYVRAGDTTYHASASQRDTPDPDGIRPATFVGASSDGSKVFFASEEMLTDNAPAGGGLYEFRPGPGSGTLDFVNGTDRTGVAQSGLVTISDDGSHVFFVSNHQVTSGQGEEGRENLYVNIDGAVHWVATNRSETDPSALIFGPATVTATGRPVDVTADGRYLAFVTNADLTGYDNIDPGTGTAHAEMYLYEDGRSGLTCISCDPAGQRPADSPSRSDALMSDATRYLATNNDAAPVVTENGSTVFTTADRLTVEDNNQRRDVYAYSDGRVHLVSSGKSTADSYLIGISPGGRDVFFATVDSLIADDQDGGNLDIYDARTEGGFPPLPVSSAPSCSGDGCQGRLSDPLGTPLSGSAGFTGSGNTTPPGERSAEMRVAKVKTVRGTSTRIKVTVPGKGKIRISGSGLVRWAMTAKKAGSYRVTVKLSKRSRNTLARRPQVRVRATVRFAPSKGKASTVRVSVTFQAKAKKRSTTSARAGRRVTVLSSDARKGR